jgi:hypothetical protein
MRSSSLIPWISHAAGRTGNGCTGDACSPGTGDGGTGRSSIGWTGSPVTRLKVKPIACFVICTSAGTCCPFTFRSTSMGAKGRSQSQMSFLTIW